jgi:hypothetical protein
LDDTICQVAQFDIDLAVLELSQKWDMFYGETWRQDAPGSPHKDTMTTMLRGPLLEDDEDLSKDIVFNRLTCQVEPVGLLFPEVYNLVRQLMYKVCGVELGRVMLVALKPGGKVTQHVDEGKYPQYYNRYHIPLITDETSLFTVGDVTGNLQRGTCYWLNTSLYEHSAVNHSETNTRVHLIVDIKSWS